MFTFKCIVVSVFDSILSDVVIFLICLQGSCLSYCSVAHFRRENV